MDVFRTSNNKKWGNSKRILRLGGLQNEAKHANMRLTSLSKDRGTQVTIKARGAPFYLIKSIVDFVFGIY